MSTWRWSNLPLPEFHLGGLLIGILLNFLVPWICSGSGVLRKERASEPGAPEARAQLVTGGPDRIRTGDLVLDRDVC